MVRTKTYFEQVPVEAVRRIAVERRSSEASSAPCTICGEHVPFEHSKTDEHGRPVHEKCYLASLQQLRRR